MTAKPSIDFERPPVVETVVGVQFAQVQGLTTSHLCAFWKALGDEWPTIDFKPPMDDQYETFGEKTWAHAQLKFTPMTIPRLQIKYKTGDRMIQVQNTRFLYNWLGLGSGKYPRYHTATRPQFDKEWAGFQQFLSERGLGALSPSQWETTYVNHLPKGTVWEEPQDWCELFCGLPGVGAIRKGDGLSLESAGGQWHFEIEPQRGRLHVELQHGRVDASGKEVLTMKLTARGAIVSDGDSAMDLETGLDLAHITIVEAFRDLTSNTARQYWREIK